MDEDNEIYSKMVASFLSVAISTLKSVGVWEMKVPSGLSDSLGIVTRKQKYITKLLYDHQFILDLVIFSKRRTIVKAVPESLCCFG